MGGAGWQLRWLQRRRHQAGRAFASLAGACPLHIAPPATYRPPAEHPHAALPRLPATPAVFPQASPFSLLGLWNAAPAPEGGEAEELVPRSHEIYRLSNLNKRRGNARKPSEMAR